MQSRARIYRRNCRNHLENSTWGITDQYHSTLSSERCSWSILFINYPAKRCFVGYCWADPPFFFSQIFFLLTWTFAAMSPFQVYFTISSCCYLKSLRNPFKSHWSRFTSSSTATNKAESSLRRHCKWIPFLVRSIHPSPSFIHRHCSLSSSFSESWFLFYLPNFFSFAQFNSVLLCFFVCP